MMAAPSNFVVIATPRGECLPLLRCGGWCEADYLAQLLRAAGCRAQVQVLPAATIVAAAATNVRGQLTFAPAAGVAR